MKKLFHLLVTVLLLMGLLTTLTACQEEETAGEKLEDAIEDVGDEIEDATDEIGHLFRNSYDFEVVAV